MPLSNLETVQMKALNTFCNRFELRPLPRHGLCGFETNDVSCLYHVATARVFQRKAQHYRWEWKDVCRNDAPGSNVFLWILLEGKPNDGNRCKERFFFAPRQLLVTKEVGPNITLPVSADSGGWGKAGFLWMPEYSFDAQALRDKLKQLRRDSEK